MEIKGADVAELIDARDLKSPGATHLSDGQAIGTKRGGDPAALKTWAHAFLPTSPGAEDLNCRRIKRHAARVDISRKFFQLSQIIIAKNPTARARHSWLIDVSETLGVQLTGALETKAFPYTTRIYDLAFVSAPDDLTL
jgi:hypothetical protein